MAVPKVLTTTHGTNREAFTLLDWGLFSYLSLVWGASFLLMAIGLDAFHPGLVTWMRVGFGALVMALIPRTRRVAISPGDRPRVGLLGLTWVVIPFTLFPIAQQWIDSAVAGMLNGAMPIFTAILATVLLRALPGRLQSLGLAIGFAGITAIALPSAGEGTTQAVGVALVVLATICYAVSVNIVMPLQHTYGSLAVLARVQWVAAILVTPYGIYGLTQSSFAWPSLLAMLVAGVLGTGVALVLMGTLTGRVGATRAAFITYLIPVVALILGVAFRSEVVAPVAVAGVGLVIAGAVLASRSEVKPQAVS